MISTDFNLNLVLLIYTGVLTGIIASTSVTSKEIENKSTTENTIQNQKDHPSRKVNKSNILSLYLDYKSHQLLRNQPVQHKI